MRLSYRGWVTITNEGLHCWLFLSDVANLFYGQVVVFIHPPSDRRNFLWLVVALLPCLSLIFDSGLSSPGLICCCAMSLGYVALLSCGCAPNVFGHGVRCHLSCPSLSSLLWMCRLLWVLFSLMVRHLRDGVTSAGSRLVWSSIGRTVCSVSLSLWLILCVGVPLWVETVFDIILDRNVAFLYLSWGGSGPSRWPPQFEGELAVGFRTRSPRRPLFCPYATVLRAAVTLWVQCVGRFPLVHDRRLLLVLSPISFRMGLVPLSEASLRALSLPARFLAVLAEAASLREFLALSSVLPYPMLRLHDHLHCACSRPKVVISA